ncbi:hypothetical protein niasHT_038960 [Heterodera trifolii]|uniref:Effector protein n=1 Tax=Heterodera trifolii TaxID=157864 RepID=A0ABD2IBX1_9BILA
MVSFVFLLLLIGLIPLHLTHGNNRIRRDATEEEAENKSAANNSTEEETMPNSTTAEDGTDLLDRMLLSGMDPSLGPMEE